MKSTFQYLLCPACGKQYAGSVVQTVCADKACGSTLFATYNLPKLSTPKQHIHQTIQSMWRYSQFLPISDHKNIVSLGEGNTPLIPLKNLRFDGNENNIFWKDESGNPTGSFKARGISAAVSKAKELGIQDIAVPTAGNAGGATAAYCARAGIKAHVYMPKETPKVFKDECRLYQAEVVEIDGNISDCGAFANKIASQNGWFQLSTLKEPYRLEGKKTMGYELAEQSNWQLPDVIFYPTGGGTGLIGLWKAFDEMEAIGWIGQHRPRMVAVQSTSCSGVVDAFHSQRSDSEASDLGFTIANGLRVPKPYASKIILDILKKSNGYGISITDKDMEDSLKEIARCEGMLIAPEGAALWSAYKQLKSAQWVKPDEKVLLLNTGSGYKYLENINIPDSMNAHADLAVAY